MLGLAHLISVLDAHQFICYVCHMKNGLLYFHLVQDATTTPPKELLLYIAEFLAGTLALWSSLNDLAWESKLTPFSDDDNCSLH